jgi:hypothetical protein
MHDSVGTAIATPLDEMDTEPFPGDGRDQAARSEHFLGDSTCPSST